VLTPPELTARWDTLRQLQADGATIVLITHKLDEVIAVSENITVMRRGETVGTLKTAGTTPSEIARAMVGREVALPARDARSAPSGKGRSLHVRDLVVQGPHPKPIVDHISFDVAPSEILGIAGVEGNGQTELIEAIAGLRRADSGAIRIDDLDLTNMSVLERFTSGLAHIPEDRHERGLVLDYSIADNLILGAQEAYASRFAIDHEKVASFAQAPDGAVWAATENGLVRWQNGVQKVYRSADGLPTDRLRSIAFDRDGTLWIGSTGARPT
jgi:simple sugar transport system ATP-binding protein